jgi:hypothetical protein
MGRRTLVAITLLLGCALAACPRPTDGEPQIAISPGFRERLERMPGHLPKAPAPPAAAHARVMRAGEQLGGPSATGKEGDWVLANGEVVFVIEAVGGERGVGERGGNLVDAADARARKDELGQLLAYLGTSARQVVYTSIVAADLPDGVAVVTARGRVPAEPAIEVETEYRLAGADRALLITTTLKNGGGNEVTLPALGDVIQWGATEKVAPGKAVGFTGASSGPFIGGVGRSTAYALTSPEGEIEATSGAPWTETQQMKSVVLAAGASVTYARVFVVGERGDVASIVAELTKASGGELGALEIALVDAAGKPVLVGAGAKVVVATAAGEEVMSVVAARSGATLRGELPPGSWLLSYAPSGGRRAFEPGRTAVFVKKDALARATLAVSDVAQVDAGCTEREAGDASAAADATTGARLPCN